MSLMKNKVVRIHADIWKYLGEPEDINAELRNRFNLPCPKKNKVSKKTKSVKPRAELLKIEPGTTMTYPRDSFKYESILNNVYVHNRKRHQFAIWVDADNIYVMRFKK